MSSSSTNECKPLYDLSQLKCPLCLEIFDEPIKLKCQHDLCKTCFLQLFEKSAFNCPLCRTRLSSWARNHKIKDIINVEKQKYIQEFHSELTSVSESSSSSHLVNVAKYKEGELYQEYLGMKEKFDAELKEEQNTQELASKALIKEILSRERKEEKEKAKKMAQLNKAKTRTTSERKITSFFTFPSSFKKENKKDKTIKKSFRNLTKSKSSNSPKTPRKRLQKKNSQLKLSPIQKYLTPEKKSADLSMMSNDEASNLVETADLAMVSNDEASNLVETVDLAMVSNDVASDLVETVDLAMVSNDEASNLVETADLAMVSNDLDSDLVETVDLTMVSNDLDSDLVKTVDLSMASNDVASDLVETVDLTMVSNDVASDLVKTVDLTDDRIESLSHLNNIH